MSTDSQRRRLLKITAGNLRQHHLYVNGHYDFFPADVVGGARRSKLRGSIELWLDGLNETVTTDIGSDAKTGKPRGFLRCRSSVRRFFEHHNVTAGSEVALERLAERSYRLTLANGSDRGRRPRAAEFFAGIGLVRLALERQGWEVVFANDIDADKAEMYRHNWPDADHLVVGDIHKIDLPCAERVAQELRIHLLCSMARRGSCHPSTSQSCARRLRCRPSST